MHVEDRLARIVALSDEKLVRYFVLLSDPRIIRNVSYLLSLENELRRRGLPQGLLH
jgi:hypothetical protein